MKVKKEELEELTKEAVKMGALNLALLLKTHCPIPELYEFTEKFIAKADEMREGLDLKRLAPKEFSEGKFSKSIKEALELMEAEDELKGKAPIGFQIPKDPSKMN